MRLPVLSVKINVISPGQLFFSFSAAARIFMTDIAALRELRQTVQHFLPEPQQGLLPGKRIYKAAFMVSVTVLLFHAGDLYGQRKCRPRSNSSSQGTSSVFIQITDETHGKVVTYEKEFKLDHIPAARREQYVDQLIESLTGSADDDDLWIEKKQPASKPIPKTRHRMSYVR